VGILIHHEKKFITRTRRGPYFRANIALRSTARNIDDFSPLKKGLARASVLLARGGVVECSLQHLDGIQPFHYHLETLHWSFCHWKACLRIPNCFAGSEGIVAGDRRAVSVGKIGRRFAMLGRISRIATPRKDVIVLPKAETIKGAMGRKGEGIWVRGQDTVPLAANSLVEELIFNFDTEDSADPLCNVWCGAGAASELVRSGGRVKLEAVKRVVDQRSVQASWFFATLGPRHTRPMCHAMPGIM